MPIPELAKDSNLGVYIELSKIPNSDKSISPMEIWSNESQERYVLAIHPDNKKDDFEKICKERDVNMQSLVKQRRKNQIKLYDEANDNYPVNVPFIHVFGDLPITDMKVNTNP